MFLEKVALIGANTNRTKAYLQIMGNQGFLINKCYIMTENVDKEKKDYELFDKSITETVQSKYFDDQEPLLVILEKYNIEYDFIPAEDINN